MRTFALAHDGIITRVVQGDQNPFHGSLTSFEVTGIPAQVGNTVDAVGNVGPSVAMSLADAAKAKASQLRGESHYRSSLGVGLAVGDAVVMFDTGRSALAALAALADGKSQVVHAADGTLARIPAATVYAAAAKYRTAVLAHEAELQDALASDPSTDTAVGWPDNAVDDAPPKVAPAIITEQTTAAHVALPADVQGNASAPDVQP